MTAANPSPIPQPTYHLADVEKRARQHPTFEIPTLAERRAIPVGHYAKLVFCDVEAAARQPAAERMWVEVSARVEAAGGGVHYVGELSNRPAFIEGLREGDEVRFEPKHVAGLATPADATG